MAAKCLAPRAAQRRYGPGSCVAPQRAAGRRQPPGPGRERSTRSTPTYGHSSDLSRGRGWSLLRRCPSRRWWTQSRRTWLRLGRPLLCRGGKRRSRQRLGRALLDRREQEEERSKREEEVKKRTEGRCELEQRLDSAGASSKRKKKRRRKRLPKSSSSRLRRGARSLVSGCCLKSTRFGSCEMTAGSSPRTVFFGSAVDAVHASVAGAFGCYFTCFCVKVDLGS